MTEWYRYQEQRYAAPLDEFDEPMGSGSVQVLLHTFKEDKLTPKGVWLRQTFNATGWVSDKKRFVLRDARKRYACPTKKEALESLIARKTKQIKILHAHRRNAEEVHDMAVKMMESEAL